MGRRKYIEDDELRKICYRYLHEELQGAGSRVKLADLVEYIQKSGYPDFKEHLLRKEPGVSIYREIKGRKANEITKALVMYKPINVDAFLETNSTPHLMRRALVQLDSKYKEIADAALVVINERNYTRSKINGLLEERDALENRLEEAETKLAEFKRKASELEAKCIALSKYINSFVNPEIANAIFSEDGLVVGDVAPHLNMAYIEENLVRGNTAIFDQTNNRPSGYNEDRIPDVPVCDEDGVVVEENDVQDNTQDDKYVHLDFLKGGLF